MNLKDEKVITENVTSKVPKSNDHKQTMLVDHPSVYDKNITINDTKIVDPEMTKQDDKDTKVVGKTEHPGYDKEHELKKKRYIYSREYFFSKYIIIDILLLSIPLYLYLGPIIAMIYPKR